MSTSGGARRAPFWVYRDTFENARDLDHFFVTFSRWILLVFGLPNDERIISRLQVSTLPLCSVESEYNLSFHP